MGGFFSREQKQKELNKRVKEQKKKNKENKVGNQILSRRKKGMKF